MKHAIAIAAVCLATALSGAAEAKTSKMMSPTMDQCKGGYQKTYSKSMNWSKKKFKKACSKMMKSDGMMMKKDGMMKSDGMMKKDGMMNKDGMMKKDKM